MLLTKSDLTSLRDLAKLRDRLAAINPGAEIREVIRGDAGPSDLIGSGRYDPESKTANVQEWLCAQEFEEHHDHHEHHHVDPNRHNDRIRAYCITRDHPISSEGFSAWPDMVSAMRGDDLLRVKGIVNITEHPLQSMVIHGVQHIF